jgi:hypothetical protein
MLSFEVGKDLWPSEVNISVRSKIMLDNLSFKGEWKVRERWDLGRSRMKWFGQYFVTCKWVQ